MGPIDSLAEPFDCLERGLFGKLTDRASLYSYLMPRRFMSLVGQELAQNFQEFMFVDEHISKFVLCFVTSHPEPDPELANLFFTIRVRDEVASEEATNGLGSIVPTTGSAERGCKEVG